MNTFITQLQSRARARYLAFNLNRDQGIQHLLSPDSPLAIGNGTFGEVVDHCLSHDRELGRQMFGRTFFRMIQRCEKFPLLVEAYANAEQRDARAMVLRALEYRVVREQHGQKFLSFAHSDIPRIVPDYRLVKRVDLLPNDWQELRTSGAAIAIVASGGTLTISLREGSEILAAGRAAILMSGAQFMIRGRGLFVFHPTGIPVHLNRS